MTAAEMMARKTRLCREIWQRQVYSAFFACPAVMLCCCALLSCFAVVLCSPHALLLSFAPLMLCCHALLDLQQMCTFLPLQFCVSFIISGQWETFLCLQEMPFWWLKSLPFLCSFLFLFCIDCLSQTVLCCMLPNPGKGTRILRRVCMTSCRKEYKTVL